MASRSSAPKPKRRWYHGLAKIMKINQKKTSAMDTPSSVHTPPPAGISRFGYAVDEVPRTGAAPQDAPTITKQMSASEIVFHLVTRGCRDMSGDLDMTTFSDYPVASGGFSDIYLGRLSNGAQIAIKTLRISTNSMSQDSKHLKRTAQELYTWSKCKHPNVLNLLGLVVFRDRIGMVSPWMSKGSLPRYLERTPGVDQCQLCSQICDGLAYLHQLGIIHGDLKGASVLLSQGGIPVLAGFGESFLDDTALPFTQTTSEGNITFRWAAPELIGGSGENGELADVYALGMTILEVMTGKVPFHGKQERTVMILVVIHKGHPERPENAIPTSSTDGNKLWGLLIACWSFEPDKRPSAAVVAERMKKITTGGLKPLTCGLQ